MSERDNGTIFADLATGCESIAKRLDYAKSERVCDTAEELERYHDMLVDEVRNLAAQLHATLAALKVQSTRDQETGQ